MKQIILVLIGVIIGLIIGVSHLFVKLYKADQYIQALETDFPDYIDITAENDAYYEYYN